VEPFCDIEVDLESPGARQGSAAVDHGRQGNAQVHSSEEGCEARANGGEGGDASEEGEVQVVVEAYIE